MKLELKLTNDWIEATWYEEVGEVKTQIHCESFSGHTEHITMLRAKAKEYGTKLDDAMIEECIANFTMPTEEELAKEELNEKVSEAQALLDSTQFKFGDDYDKKDTLEWLELKAKRQEARDFIRLNNVPNP